MEIEQTVINYICTTIYDIVPIEQSIKQLWGYDDRNFLLVDSNDHQTYVLKIVNENDSRSELTDIIDEILDSAHSYFATCASNSIVVPKLKRTSSNKLSTLVNISARSSSNGELEPEREHKQCNVKLFQYFDGMTLFDFVKSKNCNIAILSETYYELGRLCNHLFEFLRTQNHLIDKLRLCRKEFTWQLATCEPFLRANLKEFEQSMNDGDKTYRWLIEQVLDEYNSVKPRLDSLPSFVVHSDLSTRNILMEANGSNPVCLVDFGDTQVGNQLTDLAVAILYCVLELDSDYRQALERIPAKVLAGYFSINLSNNLMIADQDLELLLTLMKLRLCQSLTNAQLASKRDPNNTCAVSSLKNGWILLEILVRDRKYSSPSGMARLWRERYAS